MKFLTFFGLVALSTLESVQADGHKIVAAARSQIGVPYSWAGGSYNGKTLGVGEGAHTVGFDCSGLAQYAIFHGTGKKIARIADQQFNDKNCHHVPFAKHQPGDLIFYQVGGHVTHVTIASGPNKMIHAPQTGDHVRETPIVNQGRVEAVQRCW